MACVLSPLNSHKSWVGFCFDDVTVDAPSNGENDFPWSRNSSVSRTGTVLSTPIGQRIRSKPQDKSEDERCIYDPLPYSRHDTNDHRDLINHLKGVKRKACNTDSEETHVPTKRISLFLNTPQEIKEKKKKILKISIQKLKQIEDAEVFLRRSVLINNTMMKMYNELYKEKREQRSLLNNCSRKRRQRLEYDILSNGYLSKSSWLDGSFIRSDKITDDMTDTLMDNLAHKFGVSIANTPSARDKEHLDLSVSEYVSTEEIRHESVNFTTGPTQGQCETNESVKSHKTIIANIRNH